MTYGGPLPEPDDPRDLPKRPEGQRAPGGRHEPADPDELPQPPRLLPRRGAQGQYRNGVGTFGMYLAGIALIAEVLIGTPILLFVSLIALGCGIIGWARVHRKQANNGKHVLVCMVVAVLAVGVGWYWSTKTSQCTYVDVQKQATCIKDNAGLL